MPAGYTIRVTTPGSAGALMHEFFQVAIDDKVQAVEAVRVAAKVVNAAPVEVVGELSLADIGKAGMLRGEVLSVRRTIAGSERQGRARR